jgi:hypothetical protein
MQRYRAYAPQDELPIVSGDEALLGCDEYTTPENLAPGLVQAAVNIDFSSQDAETRGGFVCLPELGNAPFDSPWASRTSAEDNTWMSVAYGAGRFVAIAFDGANRVMTSEDGLSWSASSAAAVKDWAAVVYGGNQFVAVAQAGVSNLVMTSPDGLVWTSRASAADETWNSIAYGNGVYVAVAGDGVGGAVMTSSDGVTWTSRTPAADLSWKSVTYGNGLFVAVATTGTGNRVMTSPDGVTWTSRTSAANITWNSVTYGNGLFVAVGSGGSSRVMTSPDGSTWTLRTAAALNNWAAVVYGNGRFVAVSASGSGNRAMISADGLTWVAGTSAANNSWTSVVYGDGKFVAVAGSGTGNRVMTLADITVWACGIYSDPFDAGSQWIMLVGATTVGFCAFGRSSRTIDITSGEAVSEASTVVQANNLVYIFRGADEQPLYWDGNWNNDFELVPDGSFSVGFSSIPSSNQATYAQNRMWVKNGKDRIGASDLLDFEVYDDIANDFNVNTGSSDFIVTTYPFGTSTLIVFKNKSILALNNIDGSLADVTATEITRQVGAVGLNAVVSVGPDLVYMSNQNINLLTQTSTNNALQHQTLPLSKNISKIFKRVNWDAAAKVSMGFWDNKLYVALPLDNATSCNTVCVYNFITGNWYGEWSFAAGLGLAIQGWVVATYLGEQRMHCVTEDGRIFVTDEGPADISGTTVAEISTSLTTRAYRGDNRIGRRMWIDIATWRPNFSITSYSDGVSESETILSGQTYSRSQSWLWNDSTYNLDNSSDDYNRANRKDYAGLCSHEIQPQSGFYAEQMQEQRLPVITRRSGRLQWFKLTNTQGRLSLRGIGAESRAGSHSSLTQVL